ncbi:MAG: acyl-phosphate glycerol 3-phosphate acyltransferase [Phycisphaerae bacterium]|nr:acyl-phosphate glycerol 3-phosphate acyltransferase [Phycisphaerae bacterium]
MEWIICIVLSYLVGAIPFGVLIARARGVNIFKVGSGNIGATNVGRIIGRPWGIACFLLDAGKGAVAVAASGSSMGVFGKTAAETGATELWLWLAVLAASLMGHMFSPYIGFRGGKGVATGFGGLLAMWPVMTIPAVIALLCWVIVVLLSRYVSLASTVAACSLPVVVITMAARQDGGLSASMPLIIVSLLLCALVVFRHRGNIARLRAGTEHRIGGRGSS